jgi:hypothetical protein
MSYREDQHLRAVATEAGRTDLVEALDQTDAELSDASIQTREAYQRYEELSRAQDRKAEDGKEIRRQIRDLAATIGELEKS